MADKRITFDFDFKTAEARRSMDSLADSLGRAGKKAKSLEQHEDGLNRTHKELERRYKSLKSVYDSLNRKVEKATALRAAGVQMTEKQIATLRNEQKVLIRLGAQFDQLAARVSKFESTVSAAKGTAEYIDATRRLAIEVASAEQAEMKASKARRESVYSMYKAEMAAKAMRESMRAGDLFGVQRIYDQAKALGIMSKEMSKVALEKRKLVDEMRRSSAAFMSNAAGVRDAIQPIGRLREGYKILHPGVKNAAKAVHSFGMKLSWQAFLLESAHRQITAVSGAMWQFGRDGAMIMDVKASFERMSETMPTPELHELRKAVNDTVSDHALMRVANLSSTLGVAGDDITTLTKIAKAAAVSLGKTTEEMMEDLLKGTARRERRIIDNLGIKVEYLTKLWKDLADERGKAVTDLTEEEKNEAFIKHIISQSDVILERQVDAKSDGFLQLEARIQNATDAMKVWVAETLVSSGILDGLVVAGKHLVAVFEENKEAIMGVAMTLSKDGITVFVQLVQILGELTPLLELMGIVAHRTMQATQAFLEVVKPLFSALGEGISFIMDVTGAFGELASQLTDVTSAADDAKEAIRGVLFYKNLEKNAQDEFRRRANQAAADAELSAVKLSKKEISKRAWREFGGDTYLAKLHMAREKRLEQAKGSEALAGMSGIPEGVRAEALAAAKEARRKAAISEERIDSYFGGTARWHRSGAKQSDVFMAQGLLNENSHATSDQQDEVAKKLANEMMGRYGASDIDRAIDDAEQWAMDRMNEIMEDASGKFTETDKLLASREAYMVAEIFSRSREFIGPVEEEETPEGGRKRKRKKENEKYDMGFDEFYRSLKKKVRQGTEIVQGANEFRDIALELSAALKELDDLSRDLTRNLGSEGMAGAGMLSVFDEKLAQLLGTEAGRPNMGEGYRQLDERSTEFEDRRKRAEKTIEEIKDLEGRLNEVRSLQRLAGKDQFDHYEAQARLIERQISAKKKTVEKQAELAYLERYGEVTPDGAIIQGRGLSDAASMKQKADDDAKFAQEEIEYMEGKLKNFNDKIAQASTDSLATVFANMHTGAEDVAARMKDLFSSAITSSFDQLGSELGSQISSMGGDGLGGMGMALAGGWVGALVGSLGGFLGMLFKQNSKSNARQEKIVRELVAQKRDISVSQTIINNGLAVDAAAARQVQRAGELAIKKGN